ETNNTYLRHLPNGEYSENGTIFMDMDGTAPGMVDQQTTLYGHHMNDGAMFEPIDASMDQKVFDTFKKVYYITPE
ncbi:class B sortase, partial [Eubacterium callanderi]|nr:class B sortase [Eubacterium callanderi]